jgi:hypothetical protein
MKYYILFALQRCISTSPFPSRKGHTCHPFSQWYHLPPTISPYREKKAVKWNLKVSSSHHNPHQAGIVDILHTAAVVDTGPNKADQEVEGRRSHPEVEDPAILLEDHMGQDHRRAVVQSDMEHFGILRAGWGPFHKAVAVDNLADSRLDTGLACSD